MFSKGDGLHLIPKHLLIIGVKDNWKVLEHLKQQKPEEVQIHVYAAEKWIQRLFPEFRFFAPTLRSSSDEYANDLFTYCAINNIGWIVPMNKQKSQLLNRYQENAKKYNLSIIPSYDAEKSPQKGFFSVQSIDFFYDFDSIRVQGEQEKMGLIDAYVDYRSGELICCFVRQEFERYGEKVLSYQVLSSPPIKEAIKEIVHLFQIRGPISLVYMRKSDETYIFTELNGFVKDSNREAILSDYDFIQYLWNNIQGMVLLRERREKVDYLYQLSEDYSLF